MSEHRGPPECPTVGEEFARLLAVVKADPAAQGVDDDSIREQLAWVFDRVLVQALHNPGEYVDAAYLQKLDAVSKMANFGHGQDRQLGQEALFEARPSQFGVFNAVSNGAKAPATVTVGRDGYLVENFPEVAEAYRSAFAAAQTRRPRILVKHRACHTLLDELVPGPPPSDAIRSVFEERAEKSAFGADQVRRIAREVSGDMPLWREVEWRCPSCGPVRAPLGDVARAFLAALECRPDRRSVILEPYGLEFRRKFPKARRK